MTVIIERGNRQVFDKLKKEKGPAFQEAIYLMTRVNESLKGGYNTVR